jgi:hypothetical protein
MTAADGAEVALVKTSLKAEVKSGSRSWIRNRSPAMRSCAIRTMSVLTGPRVQGRPGRRLSVKVHVRVRGCGASARSSLG